MNSQYVPAPGTHAGVEVPIEPVIASRASLSSFVMIMFWIGAACVPITVLLISLSQEGFIIFKLMAAAFATALSLIPAAIVGVIGVLIGGLIFGSIKPNVREQFRKTVTDAFSSDPILYHEFFASLADSRLYALDQTARCLFVMAPDMHRKVWQVERLPLSIVRRMELLTASTSTTHARESGNGIKVTTETSSEYGIRLHYLDEKGMPGTTLIRFGKDEPTAQNWITAIGG